MIELSDTGVMEFIKTTYPVSFIAIVLVGFGASLAGFSRRAYFKNQAKLIDSMEKEIERLSH